MYYLFSKASVTAGIENSLNALKIRSQIQLQQVKNSEVAKEKVQRRIDYYTKIVEAVCREVINGRWPKNVYFFCMAPRPKYSTFTVNLVIDHRELALGGYEIAPGVKPTAFGINVVALNYGLEPRMEGPATGKFYPMATKVEKR